MDARLARTSHIKALRCTDRSCEFAGEAKGSARDALKIPSDILAFERWQSTRVTTSATRRTAFATREIITATDRFSLLIRSSAKQKAEG